MTDTRHGGTARSEAIDIVITQARVDRLDITVIDCMRLVDVLLQHPDLLQRLHDERLMDTPLSGAEIEAIQPVLRALEQDQ